MTEQHHTENPATADSADKPKIQFALQRIYVKDMSFESPMEINMRSQGKPAVSQDLHTVVGKLGDNHYEVVLTITVTVKQEDKVAFLCEVHQAGLFQVAGADEASLKHMLSSMCPSILFPYAREAIDNMAIRGGFPPLLLPPVNFDAIYARAVAEAQAKAQGTEASGDVH